MKQWILFLSAFVLVACSEDYKLPVVTDMIISCRSGDSFSVDSDLTKHSLIVGWFAQNTSGWSESPASYLPEVRVDFEGATVMFLKELVIVNSEGKQIVKAANTGGVISELCGNS